MAIILRFSKEVKVPSVYEMFIFFSVIFGAIYYKAWFVFIFLLLINLPEIVVIFCSIKRFRR